MRLTETKNTTGIEIDEQMRTYTALARITFLISKAHRQNGELLNMRTFKRL